MECHHKTPRQGEMQITNCPGVGIHAHHIARRGGAVRWFLGNGIYLCYCHHNHDDEARMNARIMDVIGFDKFDELIRLSHEIKQWRTSGLAVLKEDLQVILNHYGNAN